MKIVLINGESILLCNEKINSIVKDNKNVVSFDLNGCSMEDILLEAGYFSMFEEEKFIIVRNANFFGSGKINEKDIDILLKYLDNPNSLTSMIFICNEKIDARKKIAKKFKEKYEIISIPNLKYYEIENKVMDYIQKQHYKIDMETIKYIVANSLINYDLVMGEVEKILLYYSEPCFIKRKDVENIVSKSINTNNFLFVDALIDGDLERSLLLLNDLKVMKVEPTVLLSLLARDIRIMLQIKNLLEQNKREYEILNDLKLMDWQLEKYLKKAFPYKKKELEEWLVKLSNLDLKIKSGKLDKYYALEFNQGKHRVILYKKDNTTILDSFHHRLYPLGDFIQIVHDGKSEFLNTVTGEIKPLSLSVPLTNMKNGMIDTEKIKQPKLLFSDSNSTPFLPDLKNDEKEKENSKQKCKKL